MQPWQIASEGSQRSVHSADMSSFVFAGEKDTVSEVKELIDEIKAMEIYLTDRIRSDEKKSLYHRREQVHLEDEQPEPQRSRSAPSRLEQSGRDEPEGSALQTLFPQDAVDAASPTEWGAVIKTIGQFFSPRDTDQIKKLRSKPIENVVSGEPPTSHDADETGGDSNDIEELPHTQRSDRLASRKSSWKYSTKLNRYRRPPLDVKNKAFFAHFGEPGTGDARASVRKLQQWLEKAPPGEKFKTASSKPTTSYASHGDSGCCDKDVQDAVRQRVANLISAAQSVRGNFGKFSDLLVKRAADVAAQFANNSSRWSAYVPLSIKPIRMAREPKTSFKNGCGAQFAWHGTKERNLHAIQQHGLLIPGIRDLPGHLPNRPQLSVAHGQAYGRGIYTSSSVSLAGSYAGEGGSLLMCALNGNAIAARHCDIMVVDREDGILPVYEFRLQYYGGERLGKFVHRNKRGDNFVAKAVHKRPHANRIAAAKEAEKISKMRSPPGFVEMGNLPDTYVFPIEAQRQWAQDAIDALTNVAHDVATWRAEKAKTAGKARKMRKHYRSDDQYAVDSEAAAISSHDGVVDIQEKDEFILRNLQRKRHEMNKKKTANKKAAVQRARDAGAYTRASRNCAEKAARILKQRVAKRGGRQGPANEEEVIARKLKTKQGRKSGRKRGRK